MSSSGYINKKKLLFGSFIIGTFGILCLAIVAKAQYNTYDSDSNSDSDGNPILTQAELGKLVRNSGRHNSAHRVSQQQAGAATRNLYNRQQPLQYAPSYNKRSNSYGNDGLSNYGPSESTGRGSNQNSEADDEGDSSFGPNFGSNFDNNGNEGENEGSNAGEGQPMNLNQAASGYPGQGDYNNDATLGGSGFAGFGGSSGYGPSNDGSEFGPSDGFSSGEGRRAKSASSPMGSRGFGGEEDAGAPLYGPNSAVNGDNDDEGRAGYSPEGGNDNENDDE